VATAEINVLQCALREAKEELSAAATTCAQDRAKHKSALQALQGELAAAKQDRDDIQAQLQSTVAACDAANAKSSALQQCLDVMQEQLRTATTSTATTAVAANKSLATQQEQHQGSPSAMQDSSSTSLQAKLEEERRQHLQELRESQDKMQELVEARDKAKQHAEALLKRSGQNHIKRDWERLKGGGHFPAGADLREGFTAAFLNFESFACDAIFTQEATNTAIVAQQEEHDASLKAMQDSEHEATVATLRDKLRMFTAEINVLKSVLLSVISGEFITDKSERNGVERLPPSPPTELAAAGGTSAGAGFGSVGNAAGEGCIEVQSGDEGDNDPVFVENP
jgi:hypothetical protein